MELPGALEELVEDELGTLAAKVLGERVERGHPVGRLIRVRVRGKELEVSVGVQHVGRIVGDGAG